MHARSSQASNAQRPTTAPQTPNALHTSTAPHTPTAPHTQPAPRPRGLLSRLSRVIHRVNTVRAFVYPDDGCRDMPVEPAGFTVRVFDSLAEIPDGVARVVMPGRVVDLMRLRMRRGLARLLVVLDADGKVAAYGWNQAWSPFRRRFASVSAQGVMLGYYWTRPDQRGHGLYRYLLQLSVALARPSEPLIIYACIANTASLNGIAKAGFKPCSVLQLHRVLWLLHFTRVMRTPEEAMPPSDSISANPAVANPVVATANVAGRLRNASTTIADARRPSSKSTGTSSDS